MQRYFCDDKKNNIFNLSIDDSYHITKVMRMKLNDKIEIVYNKVTYICEVISINKEVQARIIESINDNKELTISVHIIQSLVKETKMDYILQKSTELGMDSFTPLKVDNSMIKFNGREESKINRWQRIVKEASEQSKRSLIPRVNDIIDIDDLIKGNYDLKLLCTVNEKTVTIKKVIANIEHTKSIAIVIGPEGGFTYDEEKKLIENGFKSISLGDHVLRTETASLVALSMINYELMR